MRFLHDEAQKLIRRLAMKAEMRIRVARLAPPAGFGRRHVQSSFEKSSSPCRSQVGAGFLVSEKPLGLVVVGKADQAASG